ncbi:pirin family protein [Paraglaciecola aquimarina]|uniref:Pirin family protein n=1 Tax=Paraglaciecola algarum TaxID=3050085 RepID=A0ABS9D689_9ALTE|nr:pirin family protein [Paraglaciecola sp. G1-23]MCF2948477.1 pirin family protein [Paraglaciecola sp. G1-23]
MIRHYPFQQLGKADHGWLKANHHFSFGQYYNPQRMGFGKLRVINDDKIEAGQGFPPHPHNNMEIITFVRTGQVAHKDNQGNQGVTQAGEVQVMSAGSGIQHSEYNLSTQALTLFQIWIEPNKKNVEPRWDTKLFPQQENTDTLPLLVSGYGADKDKALYIHQEARIFGGTIAAGVSLNQAIENQAYIVISSGEVEITDNQQVVKLSKGDGAEVTNQDVITLTALTKAELLVLDVPN